MIYVYLRVRLGNCNIAYLLSYTSLCPSSKYWSPDKVQRNQVVLNRVSTKLINQIILSCSSLLFILGRFHRDHFNDHSSSSVSIFACRVSYCSKCLCQSQDEFVVYLADLCRNRPISHPGKV